MDDVHAHLVVLMARFERLSPRRQGIVEGYVDRAVRALETALEVAESCDADDRRQTLARARLSVVKPSARLRALEGKPVNRGA